MPQNDYSTLEVALNQATTKDLSKEKILADAQSQPRAHDGLHVAPAGRVKSMSRTMQSTPKRKLMNLRRLSNPGIEKQE